MDKAQRLRAFRDARVRYVVCGLCSAEWHLPRVQCAVCREAGKLSYLGVEGGPRGVSAEACDGCRAYLKVVDLAEAHGGDAVADDAATLVLDLLVGERGFLRGLWAGLQSVPQEQRQRINKKFEDFGITNAFKYVGGYALGIVEGIGEWPPGERGRG